MTKISIEYLGDLRTKAIHQKSGNQLITDAPLDNNGLGTSFSPTDLVATALGTCIITVMGIKARSKNINMNGAIVKVEKNMVDNPRRIQTIKVQIIMPKRGYSIKERKLLEKTAHHCPVANSLKEGIEQLTIKWLDDE